MEKLVSVVIGAYNSAQFLSKAIESVLTQEKYNNFEIIIIDDGSTDNTREVVDRYLNDHRVKYYFQENKGQFSAKNNGIKKSIGEFIAFLDADDWWSSDKLYKQIPCFELSDNIAVVYTHVMRTDQHGNLLYTPKKGYRSGKISGPLLIDNFVTGMSSIVKRECLESVDYFDESLKMGGDYDLWLRLSAKYDFHYLDEVTYFYRQWPNQISHNHRERFSCAIRAMTRFIHENPGLVDKKTINEAWAHTYVARGSIIFNKEKIKKEPFIDYLTALKFKIDYLPAWKSIIKLLINRY